MAKPLLYPEWATTDTTLPATGNTNKQRPKESLRNTGWDKGQIPTAEEWNWQFDNISNWIEWFDENNITDKTFTLTGDTEGSASYTNEGGLSIETITSQAAHADVADKWTTPRTISFTGFANGNGDIDGSGNISIALSYGSGFTSSKSINGYAYRPDGLIEQWGYTNANTITLPITYPNACLNASISSNNTATGGYDYKIAVSNLTTSSITITKDTDDAGSYVYWRTIGF